MRAHYAIYVPGLGDHKSQGQELVTRLWRVFGVRGAYQPMRWSDKGAFKPKFQKLLDRIDQLERGGNKVSLVGTSAGASVVVAAYAERKDKVSGAVCICGKINRPESVNPKYFVVNPAFKDSLAAAQQALQQLSTKDRRRILSLHPLWDELVPVADTIIPGTKERVIPSVGHGLSIFCALTFGAYGIMRFLKRLTKT